MISLVSRVNSKGDMSAICSMDAAYYLGLLFRKYDVDSGFTIIFFTGGFYGRKKVFI
jgi:hypothetical protein